MSENQNVTLKDVARRAGVSIASVSRVLNNAAYVSKEVQQAVSAAIEELGYYQNSIARSLKTNSTLTIGFVTADISNPYIITVAKAVEDLIRVQKYNLLVCSTEGAPDRELEYLRLLMSRNIDGLVLNGTGFNEDLITSICGKIPVVLVHRRYAMPECSGDFVDSDNEEGTYALTRHLISLGHRKIFVIKGNWKTTSNIYRFNGFCRAMREIGVVVDERYPYQYDGDFTIQSGSQAVDYLCGMRDKPTAILALNNTMALGALEGMKRHNLSAPEHISIAGYNNIDYKELMAVRPTVHYIDPREIGLCAGRALLSRLEDRTLPNRDFITKGFLIPGNAVSIACEATFGTPAFALLGDNREEEGTQEHPRVE